MSQAHTSQAQEQLQPPGTLEDEPCFNLHPIYSQAKSAKDAKGKRLAQDSVPVSAPASQLILIQSIPASQMYERKGKKGKELTDTATNYTAKDSLSIYSAKKWI